jgi:hypothetical protein
MMLLRTLSYIAVVLFRLGSAAKFKPNALACPVLAGHIGSAERQVSDKSGLSTAEASVTSISVEPSVGIGQCLGGLDGRSQPMIKTKVRSLLATTGVADRLPPCPLMADSCRTRSRSAAQQKLLAGSHGVRV